MKIPHVRIYYAKSIFILFLHIFLAAISCENQWRKNITSVFLRSCHAAKSSCPEKPQIEKIKESIMKNTCEISMQSQTLGMETLGNARELGGYRTTDGFFVKRGVLLRSARPIGASQADLDKLRDVYHLAVIADFRMSYEIEAKPTPAIGNAKNVWCPIIDEALISANVSMESLSKKLRTIDGIRLAIEKGIVGEKMYVDFVSNSYGKKGYAKFFRELIYLPEGKSILFHCTQGKDRTGLGAMLILSALGVDEDTIIQDYLLTNVFNAPLIEKERQALMQYNLSDAELQSYLSVMDQVNVLYMQNALDYLKKNYGSVLDYIKKELCVSEDEIELLKEKFLEKN